MPNSATPGNCRSASSAGRINPKQFCHLHYPRDVIDVSWASFGSGVAVRRFVVAPVLTPRAVARGGGMG